MDEIIQLYQGPMARPIGYCTEGPFKGWIFAKHPDGQWVSLAKIPEPEAIPEAKPEPPKLRECWVQFNERGTTYMAIEDEPSFKKGITWEWVHMREATPNPNEKEPRDGD